ncbi:MAG: hypothetical protein JXQ96_08490 [Cyclobacteriaceae bacterium]
MRTSTLKILLASIAMFFVLLQAHGQSDEEKELAQLNAELDELLSNEEDSLSLYNLIESVLSSTSTAESFLVSRIGFSSRVTSAGRSFGVDQQAVIPGITYYHKSGMFVDVTGIWNSDLTPKYFLTLATLGYMGNLSKKWSYILSYDHSFYHSNDGTYLFPLTNSLNSSVSVDLKHLYIGIDYSFSFGEETANSITWNATGVIKKRAFKPFKNVTFFPSISILFGNQNITELQNVSEPRPQSVDRLFDRFPNLENTLPNLTDRQIQTFVRNNQMGRRTAEFLIYARDNNGTTTNEITSTQFGLMNYYLSLPVRLSTNKLGITIGYNYNIPRALSNSDLSTDTNGYFSFTLSYNIGL